MKATLICTLKNEKKHLNGFLESIEQQDIKPDEVIFVDGGSTDGTIEILKAFSKKYRKVKFFVKPGLNIAQGRNFAIEHARNEIIAATDAGCILDKNWFKNITSHFPAYDVASGVFKPYYENTFQQAAGAVICKDIEKLDDSFLPSSRSIAFKKSAWKAIDGYPEKLYTGEDTLFDLRLKTAGFKFILDKKAVVYWRMRSSMKGFAKQFYLYGAGDRKSRNILRLKLNLVMVIGFYLYVVLLGCAALFMPNILWLLASLIVLYMVWGSIQVYIKTRNIICSFFGAILIVIKRLSYIIGVTLG